jgi:hypothetical protein
MNWKSKAGRAGKVEELRSLVAQVECDTIRPMIQGRIHDTYRGREVVQFQLASGVWGIPMKGSRARLLTLHNGILNQCSLEETPTPYWSVLDAAIDLKVGFRKRDVINHAVLVVGEAKRRACEMAWDVLRNHHRHARKKTAGMSYMIDSEPSGKLLIRGRGADETMAYFEAEEARATDAARVMHEVAAVAEVAE